MRLLARVSRMGCLSTDAHAQAFAIPTTEMPPLVSVITPAYNAARYLPELFASIRAQTWSHIEHVVVDDGSTDGNATRELLASTPGIVWHTQANAGQYATINRCLSTVRGDIVTIISADDYYADEHAIETAVRALDATGESVGGVYGRALYVDDSGNPLSYQPPHLWPRMLLPYLFTIPHCSLFLRREEVLKRGIAWDSSLRYVGDAEWILQLMKAGVRLRRIPQALACYRMHGGQLSADSANAVRVREHAEFDRRHGVVPVVDMAVRAMIGVRRRLLQLRTPRRIPRSF